MDKRYDVHIFYAPFGDLQARSQIPLTAVGQLRILARKAHKIWPSARLLQKRIRCVVVRDLTDVSLYIYECKAL